MRPLFQKNHRNGGVIGERHELELINAFNPLGLLIRVDKAAERRLELLSTRAVRHAAQAGAVPVDLAGLGVEGGFLAGLLLELLGRLHGIAAVGGRTGGLLLLSFFADARRDGVEGWGGGGLGVGLGLTAEGDCFELVFFLLSLSLFCLISFDFILNPMKVKQGHDDIRTGRIFTYTTADPQTHCSCCSSIQRQQPTPTGQRYSSNSSTWSRRDRCLSIAWWPGHELRQSERGGALWTRDGT